MTKTVLVFGSIAGAIMSIMFVLTLPFSEQLADKAMIIGYTTMVLAFLLIYFGIRSYRDNVGGGTVSFVRGLKIGALITVVASVLYVATWEVIYYNFMPDFADKYAAGIIEKEQASGKTPAQVEAKRAELAKFKEMWEKPLFNIGFTFLEPLPVGLIMTVLCAGLMSKKKRKELA